MDLDYQFKGFPKEGLQFLTQLTKNNNSTWFNTNKGAYTEYLLEPAQAFVQTFGLLLRKKLSRKIIFDTRTNGSGSIFRIRRDSRFILDKPPYKTHVGIYFWEDRQGKKMDSPGIYFHLEDQGAQLHMGQYEFNKEALARFRKAVSSEKKGGQLEAITQDLVNNSKYLVGGEHYKTVPKDFEPDHARAGLLKYNGLYCSSPWISSVMLSNAKLPEVCLAHCQHMEPIFQWLVKNKI